MLEGEFKDTEDFVILKSEYATLILIFFTKWQQVCFLNVIVVYEWI